MSTHKALVKIIKIVGSQAELARQLGVSRGNVSDWVDGRRNVPAKKVRALVLLSKGLVVEKDIRPDIFG